jgi:asparagine synthase (glutamine-hydrolysing)
MCGIFGVISKSISIDEKIIIASRDIMAHRGPDDSGIYISPDKTAALAHRRLSILDLTSAAHQPMTIDNRYTIVFNGEIYNYRDLKNRLTTHKNKIQSSSDTEVLLDLYAEYGIDCIKMLRGMFAFAIWDDKEKILFAARDRFGIKPFYYYNDGSQFIFSSELKAIKHYKKDLTISNEGIDAFLRTGSVPAPLTIYKEVKSLLPGHYLVISNKKMVISEYWNFNNLFSENSSLVTHHSSLITDSSSLKKKYDDEAKKKIRTALLDSVSAHMVADVEVGAFLSGGIDSTAIVSLMRQVGQEKIKTINISFPGNKLDEAVYARKASDFYSTANYEYNLTEHEVIEELDKIFYSMDQPTIDGINTYFVSKAARELGLNVVLSGVGGDELFGGYPSFINIPKYRKIKNLSFARSLMSLTAPLMNNRLPAKAIKYMKNPDAPNSEYQLIRGLFTDDELKKFGWTCHPEPGLPRLVGVEGSVISSEARNLDDHSSLITDYSSLISDHSSLITISELETTHYMRSQLLRDSDVFSMAHSLELRVPFVDHLLYETVLPYLDSGFDKINPKKMLVDAVGDLPGEITHRSKMGFTFPFEDWIKNGEFKYLMIESIKNLDNTFATDHLLPTIDKLHWSRLWALYVLSRFV